MMMTEVCKALEDVENMFGEEGVKHVRSCLDNPMSESSEEDSWMQWYHLRVEMYKEGHDDAWFIEALEKQLVSRVVFVSNPMFDMIEEEESEVLKQ